MPDDVLATWHGLPIRYIALVTMCVQNAAAALIMHYSRVMPGYEDKRYFSSTAVFLSEVIKLVTAMIVVRREHLQECTGRASPTWIETVKTLMTKDSWKLIIPAGLYTVQNNLQYLAMTKLDAATFQVSYQLKLLTTALFSVIILRKQISLMRWGALVILTAGVALVSLPDNATVSDPAKTVQLTSDRHVGLIAVILACCLSGLAGVYFEKVLKGSNISLWNLNVQLSFFAMFPAFFLGVVAKDGAEVLKNGFFFGYNYIVWMSIVIQAVGGLIVAICVFYTDNIKKNFATSIAVLLSAVASVFMFGFVITRNFYVGSSLVFLATFIYAQGDNTNTKDTADYTAARTSEDVEAQEYDMDDRTAETK